MSTRNHWAIILLVVIAGEYTVAAEGHYCYYCVSLLPTNGPDQSFGSMMLHQRLFAYPWAAAQPHCVLPALRESGRAQICERPLCVTIMPHGTADAFASNFTVLGCAETILRPSMLPRIPPEVHVRQNSGSLCMDFDHSTGSSLKFTACFCNSDWCNTGEDALWWRKHATSFGAAQRKGVAAPLYASRSVVPPVAPSPDGSQPTSVIASNQRQIESQRSVTTTWTLTSVSGTSVPVYSLGRPKAKVQHGMTLAQTQFSSAVVLLNGATNVSAARTAVIRMPQAQKLDIRSGPPRPGKEEAPTEAPTVRPFRYTAFVEVWNPPTHDKKADLRLPSTTSQIWRAQDSRGLVRPLETTAKPLQKEMNFQTTSRYPTSAITRPIVTTGRPLTTLFPTRPSGRYLLATSPWINATGSYGGSDLSQAASNGSSTPVPESTTMANRNHTHVEFASDTSALRKELNETSRPHNGTGSNSDPASPQQGERLAMSGREPLWNEEQLLRQCAHYKMLAQNSGVAVVSETMRLTLWSFILLIVL